MERYYPGAPAIPARQAGTHGGRCMDIIWKVVVALLYAVIVCVPAGKVLKRTGHSGWWALLLLVPVANLVAYWVFAFKKWPAEP